MTTTSRRTEITIETHEITVIRRHRKEAEWRYCRCCQSQVVAYQPDDLAVFFHESLAQIQDLVRQSEIHFIEVPEDGPQLICGRSLGQSKNKKQLGE